LDKDTRDRLSQGERIMEVLKQPQYAPYDVADQIIILYAVTRKYLMSIEVSQVKLYEKKLLDYVDIKYPELKDEVRDKAGLTEELDGKLKTLCEEFAKGLRES
jgi:F-type H+/Na+-transporting ATPase subunit alpha